MTERAKLALLVVAGEEKQLDAPLRRKSRGDGWVAAGALLTTCAPAALAGLSGVPAQWLRPFPFVLTLTVLTAATVREARVRDLSPLSPLVIVGAAIGLLFGVIPLVDMWFVNPLTLVAEWWRCAWIACAGVGLFVAAYLGGVTRSFQPMTPRWDGWSPGAARAVALILLLAGAVLVLPSIGGLSGLRLYLENFAENRRTVSSNEIPGLVGLSLVMPAVLIRMGTWTRRPEWRGGLLFLLVWLPAALLITGAQGERSRPMAIVVSCIILLSAGRRRIKARVVIPVFAIIALGFVGWGLQRNLVGSDASAPSIAGRSFYSNYVGPTHEFSQFRDFVVLTRGVPSQLPYQYGRTLLSAIPAAPFETGGYVFSATFYPSLYSNGTSIGVPLPAELYLNFGLGGTLLGMAGFGVLLGALEGWFRDQRGRLSGSLIYAYCIPPLAYVVRGDFTSFVSPYGLGLLVLITALAGVSRVGSALQSHAMRGLGHRIPRLRRAPS